MHLLARATEAAVYTGDLRRCREAATVSARLGIIPPGTLAGLAAAVEGRYEDARNLLKAAAGRCGPGGDPTLLIHSGIAALLLGDRSGAERATVRAAASARARGETVTVPQAMEFRAYADFWTGRPRAAETAAADALWQAYATGQDNGACHLQAALAMFAAVTGDGDVCRERAEAARTHARAHGLGLPAALALWALAFLDLSTGRFESAAARLRALAGFGPGHGHRAIRHLATPHYVEAAVRTGDTRVARAAHADYDRWAAAVRSTDDLALSARCRALLAPGAEAVDHSERPSTCTPMAPVTSNGPVRSCCSAVRCVGCGIAPRLATGCTVRWRPLRRSGRRTVRRRLGRSCGRWGRRRRSGPAGGSHCSPYGAAVDGGADGC